MVHYLDRSPFTEQPNVVIVRGERISVRPHQIIAWVTLTHERTPEPNPVLIPFPAIVDTGNSQSFSILARHLTEWAGIPLDALRILGAVRDKERGIRILRRHANIWMHCNKPGRRDEIADRPPERLRTPDGIVVYPDGAFPRLPLIGLRAISENQLILKVDGNRREAVLLSARQWWPFS